MPFDPRQFQPRAPSSPAPTPASARRPRWPWPGRAWTSGSPGTPTRRAPRPPPRRCAPSAAGRTSPSSTRPTSPAAATSSTGWPSSWAALDVFVNNAGTGDGTAVARAGPRHVAAARWPPTSTAPSSASSARRGAWSGQGRGGRIIAITSVHEHQPRVGSERLRRGQARPRRAGEDDRARARRAGHHRERRRTGGDRHTDDRPDRRGPDADRAPGRAAAPPRRRPRDRRRRRVPRLAGSPATSPAPRGWSTAGCCRWGRRPARTSRADDWREA